MLRWFEQNGPEGDVVISSRVRLARNLKDYNFSLKLDTPDAHKMIGEAAQKLRVLPEFKDFHEYHFENLEEVQREAMKERHVISPFLLSQSVAGGFVSSNEDLSIMLNEEDHIRIQAYRAGMDMERAYEAADHIDDCIGAVLPYAYDTQYGYLTTCPSNVGTGMRVSYMCHLPALAWNNKIQGIAAEIGRFGLVMHSVYSDGNKSAGDIYQISNQITLGVTEKELIENITNIVQQIVTQERILRNRLKEKQKISVLDGIYRSYGILKYAGSCPGCHLHQNTPVLQISCVRSYRLPWIAVRRHIPVGPPAPDVPSLLHHRLFLYHSTADNMPARPPDSSNAQC